MPPETNAAPAESPPPQNRLQRLADFLGLKRSIVALLSMVILVGMGEHMAEQFLPLYLIALGGGILSAGGLNAMDNLLGALYSYPGGYLADRYGNKRALLIFNLIAIAGFLIVILVPAWQAVLAASALFLSWTAISLPATMGLVSKALPKSKRTMGVSVHSLVRRVPMALGPMLGGWFIVMWGERDGVRLAFVVALAMAVVALVVQQMMVEDDKPEKGEAEGNPIRMLRLMSPDLRNLLVSDILIRFCEQIPYAFVVLWCVKSEQAQIVLKQIAHPISAYDFGILRSIEMATAILVYLPVAYLADKAGKKPFVTITFVFFTAFPMAIMHAPSFVWLVPAFVLRGLKEFGEPSRKALIMDLAPEGKKAGMFGAYYLVRDVIVAVAAFGGAFLWQVSPEANFYAATAFGAVGTIWFAAFGQDLGTASGGAAAKGAS